MILVFLLVLFSTLAFVFYHKQKRVFKTVEHIPGPPTLPFLGNALEFGTNTVDVHRKFKQLSEKYGPVVRLCVGTRVFILLSDPQYISQVVKHSDEERIGELNEYLLPLIGRGLLTMAGKAWYRHRRILNRFFNAKHMEKYATIINSNGNQLVKRLGEMVGHNSVDITNDIFGCSLNIICNAVMHVDVTENKSYLKASDGMLNLSTKRFLSILKKIDVFYRFTPDYKLQQKYMKALDDFYEGVLTKHKKNILSEEEAARKGAIIDELLSLRGEDALTHEEIRGEMQTLISAGAETIGTSLAFMLHEFAKHPDVQEKILEEIQEVLGPDKESAVTFEDAHQLKYTECVVKESLRLYTPVSLFPKVLGQEVKIANMSMPAGAEVLLYFGGMHASPDYFVDPEKFHPERFFSENHGFVPFGMGPKMCLGYKFALLEAKILIAQLVRNFEFLPAQPEHRIVFKLEGVLKSANGVSIAIKFRES